MEPFQYEKRCDVPILSLTEWTTSFPELEAGMSVCDGQTSPAKPFHYGLHREHDEPRDVIPAREKLVEACGFTLDAWTCANQVHGTNVVRVGRAERGAGNRDHQTAIPDTDGLITDEPDVWLAAFYADCVPLLFWDPVHHAVGAAHAGWRGTTSGIATEIVRRMTAAFQSDPAQLHVAIAPSIGPCCYEVDDKVVNALRVQLPSLTDDVLCSANREDRYMLDLKQANACILQRAGISDKNIRISDFCTKCDDDLFHSHRREGDKSGRMVVWIAMRKDDG